MKKIIVPIDFSDGAFNALIHALQYAQKLHYSVEVLHAFMLPPTGTAVMVDITDVLKKNAMEELSRLRKKVSALPLAEQVSINYQAEHGTVVDVINRAAAKDPAAALVMMGTQGASGITEKWLGSNTAAAARNVHIPLLAIPADKPFKTPKRIIFSTDLKVLQSTKQLEVVAHMAHIFECDVKFIHVRKRGDDANGERSGAFKEQVAAAFGEHEVTFAFLFDNDVEAGIKDAVETDRADMLVLVRHEYGFFESIFHSSVTQQIVNSAALPILVIRG